MTSLVYMFDPNPTYGSKHRERQAAQKVPFVDKLSYFSLNLAGRESLIARECELNPVG